MWKDEYCIGVESIDKQHQSLFEKTAELESIVKSGVSENRQAIIENIVFLKGYALNHFSDEEAYQKSIKYAGFDEHQAQHKSFIQTLLRHEREMKNADFADEPVRTFVKTLKVWLVFHVTNSDQRIVGKSPIA
jgi:hemerythrin-like metal-binding protein